MLLELSIRHRHDTLVFFGLSTIGRTTGFGGPGRGTGSRQGTWIAVLATGTGAELLREIGCHPAHRTIPSGAAGLERVLQLRIAHHLAESEVLEQLGVNVAERVIGRDQVVDQGRSGLGDRIGRLVRLALLAVAVAASILSLP
jgi:hypothetical protein